MIMANSHFKQPEHTLPLRHGPSSSEDPVVGQDRSIIGNHPYQLPPPQSTRLPFASDDYRRQQQQRPERTHAEISPPSGDALRLRKSREQLPSVTELLSPSPHGTLLPSPYTPVYLGGPPLRTPPHDVHEPPENFSHLSLQHKLGPGMSSINPRPSGPYEYFQPPRTRNLPSLSEIGFESSYAPGGETRPHSVKNEELSRARGHFPNRDITGSPEKSPQDSPSTQTQSSKEESPHTGTQRLAIVPQVVDERYVEGEGICYIYADGSYCPKTIDGELVNANWGVTKAGKPRKRLAQACITCREKKIKCHPNLPKCEQCQKSGRECRFETVPRGSQPVVTRSSSYDSQHMRSKNQVPHPTTPSSSHESTAFDNVARASESSSSITGPTSQSPVSERHYIPGGAPDAKQDATYSHKRRRRGSVEHSGGSADSSKSDVDFITFRSSSDRSGILMEVTEQDANDTSYREWSTDPFEANAESTMHYLEMYLVYVNSRIFQLVPKEPFLLWVKSSRAKSLDDKMLLYSMLAMGSIFSDRSERIVAGKRFFTTAKYAVDKSQHRLTLQLAQSRIILSLWYSAIGAMTNAWDFIGSASRAVCGLRYNVEPDGAITSTYKSCEYGLHPQALVECHRRTFWAVFILDRFSSFYSLSPLNLPTDDIFLKLPCHEDDYDAQNSATMPLFQDMMNDSHGPRADRSGFGFMAVLVEIMSVWGDVSSSLIRAAHMPLDTYRWWFERFYDSKTQQVETWMRSLPESFAYNATNVENNFRLGRAGNFFSVHILYHATLMRLNRHVRAEGVPGNTIDGNTRRTRYHGTEILRMVTTLSRLHHEPRPQLSHATVERNMQRTMLPIPHLSYAILSAADVVTALGVVADIRECVLYLQCGLDVVEDMCRFWDIARPQSRLLRVRLNSLAAFPKDVESSGVNKMFFKIDGQSMDSAVYSGTLEQNRMVGSAGDLIYGLPYHRHFKALGIEAASIHSDNVVLL